MKAIKPVRTTIVYGILCGLCFVPLTMLLVPFFSWPMTIRLIIWLYLAVYGMLLVGWAQKNPARIVFPLLLLLFFIPMSGSAMAFLFLAMATLSWIRSGVCFPGNVFHVLFAEGMVCLGGGALAAFFAPHSTMTLALAVWLFVLIQALYFVLFRRDVGEEGERRVVDLFEQARKQAEKIVGEKPL